MKLIQKILNTIGILMFLLVLFVILCNFNPDISKKLGSLLNPGTDVTQDVSGNAPAQTAASVTGTDMNASGETAQTQTVETGSTDAVDGLNLPAGSSGYVPPSRDNLQIPDDVSGKNGFVPVTGNGRQVDQSQAESLKAQVGPGETGEGLTFDESAYPYYGMLSTDLKKLYCQIYANMNALTDQFTPVVSVSGAGLKSAYTAVSNDHPEIFWIDTAYSYSYDTGGNVAVITLEYNQTADQLDTAKNTFENQVNSLIASAQSASSGYDKEKAAHDALLSHVTYNLSADMNQSAYSAVVNGQTVCAGYAKAFQYMMQKLGVNCYYCTGFAGENHAWNIISLDDGYYNVDTTWDDTDPSTYNYFDCSDEDFATDHVRTDMAVNLPPCNGSQFRKLLADANSAAGAQTLAQAGFSESDILTSLDGYYADCLSKIDASTDNPVTFESVIADNNLLQAINAAYRDNSYQAGFGTQALTDKGMKSMRMQISVRQLQEGYYVLSHTFTFS